MYNPKIFGPYWCRRLDAEKFWTAQQPHSMHACSVETCKAGLASMCGATVAFGAVKIFAVRMLGHLVSEIRNRLKTENFWAIPKFSGN